MRILVISQYYDPEPFKVSDLCRELYKKGHRLSVITSVPNYPDGQKYIGYRNFHPFFENDKGIKIVRIPVIKRGRSNIKLALNYISYSLLSSIFVLFIFNKYDLVYIYQLSPVFMAVPGIVFSKLRKIPLLLYCLDIWPDSFFEITGIKSKAIKNILISICNNIYKQSNLIAVSSKSFRNRFIEIGFSEDKISTIPQYDDTIGEMLIDQSYIINKYNNYRDYFDIYFTGNVGFAQNLDIVLDAAEIIKESGYKIRWNIVGDGRAKSYLIKKAKNKGLENIVLFFPRIEKNKISDTLSHAHAALLILGNSELFSLTVPAKLQTYMANSIPILGCVNGESANIIVESNSGFIAEQEDPRDLAKKAIMLASSNPEKLIRMAMNAKAYYNKYFTKEQHIEKMVDFMTSGLISKKSNENA